MIKLKSWDFLVFVNGVDNLRSFIVCKQYGVITFEVNWQPAIYIITEYIKFAHREMEVNLFAKDFTKSYSVRCSSEAEQSFLWMKPFPPTLLIDLPFVPPIVPCSKARSPTSISVVTKW